MNLPLNIDNGLTISPSTSEPSSRKPSTSVDEIQTFSSSNLITRRVPISDSNTQDGDTSYKTITISQKSIYNDINRGNNSNDSDDFDLPPIDLFEESDSLAATTGFTVWNSSDFMVDYFIRNQQNQNIIKDKPIIEHKRIIELGSGTGYLGLCLAACIRIKHSVLMGRARPIKTLCFMRIEWLRFDDYVPARITKKSLGFVPFLRWL